MSFGEQTVRKDASFLREDKFSNPDRTAGGEPRAGVDFRRLKTLWINTGTLCNLTCEHCYIESSPTNDRLSYIERGEVAAFLDEIDASGWRTEEIGFTGGEPFMNPDIDGMLADVLDRGHRALVLTNAMKPMSHHRAALLALRQNHGDRLVIRVSVDHYSQTLHELERGVGSWAPMIDGLVWLCANDFQVHVAGRTCWQETESRLRAGYTKLFLEHGINVAANDPARLTLFPEMDEKMDVPEISVHCWGVLEVDPADVMCATSRMVVKRKGASDPAVLPCTLLPCETEFEMGSTLAAATETVKLNHPHCARFCVLGGGSCSQS